MVGTYQLWFRRKFNLPPTDPRYLNATPEQIVTEFWAHYFEERRLAGKPEEEEFEDETFDEDLEAIESNPEAWETILSTKAE